MKRAVLLGALLMALAGCGGQKPPADPGRNVSAPANAEQIAFEKLREGLFALGAVVDGLAESRGKAEELSKGAKGDAKAALVDVVNAIDSVGESLTDYTTAPANRADFDAEFAKWDETRLKAIEVGTDAHVELEEARETVRAMVEDKAIPDNGLLDLLVLASNDLRDAVELLGGKFPDETEVEPEP